MAWMSKMARMGGLDVWMRGGAVVLAGGVLAIAAACDPKPLVPADDGAIEQDDAGQDDDGNETEADTDQPGTSVGSGATSGDGCEGDECPVEPPVPQPMHAYFMRFGDLPDIDVGSTDTGGSGAGDGGSDIDPDALHVIISTGADDCDDPYAALACGAWRVSFTLPADAAAGTFELFPDLNGTQTATGPLDENDECYWGGGTLEGSLVIESLDEGTISGHIEDAVSFDFDADVEFVAHRCP